MNDATHTVTDGAKHLGLFGRADLFAARTAYGWGSVPCSIWLRPNLDERQRAEAQKIVEGVFPVMGYGWRVDGDKIEVWSCE